MSKLAYALREIKANADDWQWWRNRFIDHVIRRYFSHVRSGAAEPVIDMDWDNLMVLDACRYDLFVETLNDYTLPGVLERRIAAGTGTPDFLKYNFRGCHHDIVYVTANPYVQTELDTSQFHAVDSVWRDGWSGKLDTVLPEVMLERTQQANEEYPDKRIITHFLQPHFPFIGEFRLGDSGVTAIRQRALKEGDEPHGRTKPTPFEKLRTGGYTAAEVWGAYRSNLERALPAVKQLLQTLPGRTAVTSDHGNAFGEFAWPFPLRIYGHPLGVRIPALTHVPWLTFDNGSRKSVRSEVPDTQPTDETEVPEDRLRDLGYVE